MKTWILSSLFFLSLATSAADKNVQSFEVKQPKIGTLKVQVIDVEEPVFAPYRMSVSIQCAAQKATRVVIDSEAICDFRQHVYDAKSGIVTLRYSTSELQPGEAQCNGHWAQDFNLKELCAP